MVESESEQNREQIWRGAGLDSYPTGTHVPTEMPDPVPGSLCTRGKEVSSDREGDRCSPRPGSVVFLLSSA